MGDSMKVHKSSTFPSSSETEGDNELRIILLGKTGVGKSSIGNTILGEEVFKAKCSQKGVTQICQRAEKEINGRRIVVIDTPGIFDTDRPEKDVKREVISCLVECAPGPHVLILVLEVGRHTKENQQAVEKLRKYFSDKIFPHMIMVFTHGEDLEEDMTISKFINQSEGVEKKKKSGKFTLKDLAEKCGNRVHVIDNKHWNRNENSSRDSALLAKLKQLNLSDQAMTVISDKMQKRPAEENPWFNVLSGQFGADGGDERGEREYRSNRFQLTQLMRSVKNIWMENKGQPYSNEALEEIGNGINQEVENILKEMVYEWGDAEEGVDLVKIRARARERVRTELERKLSGVAVGVLLGALLWVGVGLAAPLVFVAGLIRAALKNISNQRHPVEVMAGASVVAGVATEVGLAVTAGGAAEGAVLSAGAASGAGAAAGAEAAAVGAGAATGIGVGTATGIGLGVGAGILLVCGALKGGATGYTESKKSDNPKQAAGKAGQSAAQKAEDVLKKCWNLGKSDPGVKYEQL